MAKGHNLGYRTSQKVFTKNAVQQKKLNNIDRYSFRGGIRL